MLRPERACLAGDGLNVPRAEPSVPNGPQRRSRSPVRLRAISRKPAVVVFEREDQGIMRPTLRSEEPSGPKFFKRFKEAENAGMRIDEDAVRSAYRRWAPVYDHTFGRVAAEGRKH